jgi:probable F420-dependent oxidoreductase
MAIDVGIVGIFTASTAFSDPGASAAAIRELDELGYGAVWLGTSPSGDLRLPEQLLGASRRIAVATDVVVIWRSPAAEVAESYRRVTAAHPGRFLLGLGVSHSATVGERYVKPLEALDRYLDQLDAASPPVPVDGRVVGALGPRALAQAARRAGGAAPYLVTPQHTRRARGILGPDALLAPEQKVLLEEDPARARATARQALAPYLRLDNYVRNLRRDGFTDEDVAAGGSDRLVDALVAWGDVAAVQARVEEHLAAGADHVALHAIGVDRTTLPRDRWRALAEVARTVTAADR